MKTFEAKLAAQVEKDAGIKFPCVKPCDSFGVCDNCNDALIWIIGASKYSPALVKARADFEKIAKEIGAIRASDVKNLPLAFTDPMWESLNVVNRALDELDALVGEENEN